MKDNEASKQNIEEIEFMGKGVEELLSKEKDLEFLKTLSPMRGNLVSWLDVRGKSVFFAGKERNVLAGFLRNMGAKVVTEADDKKDRYDYVFVTGDAVQNLKVFTEKCKPEGAVIVAADNKLGIRNFSGKTDTVNQDKSGAEDKTSGQYTEGELKGILENSGFTMTDVYYPVPDMTFPRMIYHKDHMPKKGIFEIPTPQYENDRIAFFDEVAFMDMLGQEGLAGHFANSFLIIAGKKNKVSDKKLIYARFNSERLEDFRTDTFIYETKDGLDVVKEASCAQAGNHLDLIEQNREKLLKQCKSVRVAKAEKNGNQLHFEYVEGSSLSKVIGKEISSGEDVVSTIKKYIDPLLQDGIGEVINLDMIPENVIIDKEEKPVLIDYEWVFTDKELETIFSEYLAENEDGVYGSGSKKGFLEYRILKYLYNDIKDICFGSMSLEDLYKMMGMDDTAFSRYQELEDAFQQYVYGKDWSAMYTKNYLKRVTKIQDMEDAYSDKLRHIGVLETANRKLKFLLKLGIVTCAVLIMILAVLLLR